MNEIKEWIGALTLYTCVFGIFMGAQIVKNVKQGKKIKSLENEVHEIGTQMSEMEHDLYEHLSPEDKKDLQKYPWNK